MPVFSNSRLSTFEQCKLKYRFGYIDKIIPDIEKTIELIPIEDTTEVEVTWDIKLSGLMGMFTGMVKKHIKNGTDQALESIKQEVER